MSYTQTQQEILALVPKLTGTVGIMSAIFIISEIVHAHRKGEGNAIIRAIALGNLYQSIDSLGWFLSTWMAPRGAFAFSAGNQATCSFQGFLLQIVIGSPIYNAVLAFFFLMVVKYEKSAADLRKYEQYVHISAFTFASGTSFLMLSLGQFNNIGTVCWAIGSPSPCGHSSFIPSDVPCDRGDYAYLFGMLLFYVPLWICIVVIVFCNGINYHALQGKEASWFATQSRLYMLAFIATWAPSTTWSAMSWTRPPIFILDLSSALFEPLGPFYSLLIFLRSRPTARKKLYNLLCCNWFSKKSAQQDEERSEPLPQTENLTEGMA